MLDEFAVQDFRVQLNGEESSIFRQLFHVRSFPGLPDGCQGELDEETLVELLGSNEFSLVARGILHLMDDGENVEVEPMTLGIIGTCVYPVSVFEVQQVVGASLVYTSRFYRGMSLVVEHSMSDDGLSEFVIVNGEAELQARLLDILALIDPEEAPGSPESRLPGRTRRLIRKDFDEVGEPVRTRALEVIQAEKGALILKTEDENANVLKEKAGTASEMAELVSEFISEEPGSAGPL